MARPYQRIAEELSKRIQNGVYGNGAPLPSERALEEEFDVHRATIRRAFGILVDQGLLTRHQGQRAITNSNGSALKSLGLFAGSPDDPYSRSILHQGFAQYLSDNALPLTSFAEPGDSYRGHLEIRGRSGKPSIDGLCLLPPHGVDKDLLKRVRLDSPAVLIDRMIPGLESDFVGFQDFDAGYQAAKHLYQVGHRRISFLGSVVPETAEHRRQGVKAFCDDAGIELSWNFSGFAVSRTVPPQYVQALFEMGRETWPTAAVCTNDETAAFMISCLGQMGLRVPGDLALIGFGNSHIGLLEALGLSTMAQPYREVGMEACRLLTDRIRGNPLGETVEVRLAMNLVVRRSCGSTLKSTAAPAAALAG